METLQRRIREILERLRILSPTARLLIGSLMVTLVMALLLVSLYAGRPEMVPLPITLTADNRSDVMAYLEQRQIDVQEQGDKLYVPVGQQHTISAQLLDQEIVTGDAMDFESLIESESPFLSREQNRRRYLMAKMSVLERTISQMNGISKATVVIAEPEKMMGIGSPDQASSASVMVMPTAGALPQSKVDAVARLVAGAHAGLTVERVEVVDARSGMAFKPRSDDDLVSEDYLELKDATEKRVRDTLVQHFGYIPGIRVSVNAQMETAQKERTSEDYSDPKLATTEEESRNIASTNTSKSAEPGIRSNAGLDVSGGSGSSSTFTDDRTSAKNEPRFGTRREHAVDRTGYALKINTSITVPRSYFVGVYQQEQGDPDAVPDTATLDTLVQAETERIRLDAEPLIDTDAKAGAATGVVQVSMYHDYAVAGMGGGILGSEEGGGAMSLWTGDGVVEGAGGLVKYVSLGGLALLSLAMMFMMVRKATVREELPTAEELVGIPPALMEDESDLVGEADETPPAMEGFEVDESDLESQQMLYQVNNLASESPEEAASLMKKWMIRES